MDVPTDENRFRGYSMQDDLFLCSYEVEIIKINYLGEKNINLLLSLSFIHLYNL